MGDAELACGVGEWMVGALRQGYLVLSGLAGKPLPDSDYAAESLPPMRFKCRGAIKTGKGCAIKVGIMLWASCLLVDDL